MRAHRDIRQLIMASVVSADLIQTDIIEPHVTSRAAREALPRFGIWPMSVGLVIRGLNTSYVNAIRRILLGEFETVALALDTSTWITDDDFPIIEMIARRIALIPINQDAVAIGATFSLDAHNDSDEPRDVMTAELIATGASARTPLPFFETINIVTLGPHRSIKFTIRVERGIGDASFALTSRAVCKPLDQRPAPSEDYVEPVMPKGAYDGTVTYLPTACVSDPRVHLLEFDLTGTHNVRALLIRVIAALRARVEQISVAPVIITDAGSGAGAEPVPVHVIKMQGETYTIGQLFTHVCLETHPGLDSAVCNVDDLTGELSIRIRSSVEKTEAVIARTIAAITNNLDLLHAAIEALPTRAAK